MSKKIICPCCGTPEEDNKSIGVTLACGCDYHPCFRCWNGKCTKHCGCKSLVEQALEAFRIPPELIGEITNYSSGTSQEELYRKGIVSIDEVRTMEDR